MGIKSVLKAGIEALPDEFKTQARSIPNALKKQGVKDEELKFADLDLPEEGPVTKQDLVKAEAGRSDKFDVVETMDKSYQSYSLPGAKQNPTYRERVYTYQDSYKDVPSLVKSYRDEYEKINSAETENALYRRIISDFPHLATEEGEAEVLRVGIGAYTDDELISELGGATGSRYTSEHFPDIPNYLMHTRIYDDVNTFDQPTRVVQEVQSDLHQDARKAGGYAGEESAAINTPEIKKIWSDIEDLKAHYDELDNLDPNDWPEGEDMDEVFDEIHNKFDELSDKLGLDEFTRDEARNNLFHYNSLEDFTTELGAGAKQIPKSPYETSWLTKGIEQELKLAMDDGFGQIAIPIKGKGIGNLQRGEGVQKWYEGNVAHTARKLAKKYKMDFEIRETGKPTVGKTYAKADVRDDVIEIEAMRDNFDADWGGFFDNAEARLKELYPQLEGAYLIDAVVAASKGQYDEFASILNRYNTFEKQVQSMDFAGRQALAKEIADNPTDEHWRALYPDTDPAFARENYFMDAKSVGEDLERIASHTNTTYVLFKPKGQVEEVSKAITRDDVEADKSRLRQAMIDDDAFARIRQELVEKYGKEHVRKIIDDPEALAQPAKNKFTPNKPFTPTLYQMGGATATGALVLGSDEAKAATDPTKTSIDKQPVESRNYTDDVAAVAEMMRGTDNLNEIKNFLEAQGEDAQELMGEAQRYNEALSYGHTPEQIEQFLGESRIVEAVTINPKSEDPQGFWDRAANEVTEAWSGYRKWVEFQNLTALDPLTGQPAKRPIEDIVASLRVVYPNMTSVSTRTSGFFGNEENYRMAVQADQASRIQIANAAADMGIQLQYVEGEGDAGTIMDEGKWMVVNQDGTTEEVTPGFWASMRSESGELFGAVSGAVAGAKQTAKATKNPWLIGLGSVVGAAGGGAIGSEYDYLMEAVEMQQELNAQVAFHKATTAAEVSVIGDTIGYPLVKGLGYGWKTLKRVKNYVLDGNSQGAVAKLKSDLNMSDDEARILVSEFERLAPLPGKNQAEKEIAAITLSQPTMQDVVRVAGMTDAKAARAVAKGVNARANNLLESTAGLTEKNANKILIDDLGNYTSDVKAFYQDVKEQAARHPHANLFEFDFDGLAIQPIIEQLQKNITDQNVAYKFAKHAQNVGAMSDSRSFADLLELRKIVNDWRFNKRISKQADAEMLYQTVKRIDETIEDGARYVMGEKAATKWLSAFDTAKTQYAKMKGLEKNVLARALRRPGVSEETITKALTRYIEATDGTFFEVMEKLPPKARQRAEGSVINALAEKYTSETTVTGTKAVDFMSLSDSLDGLPLVTPDARRMRDAIGRMAKVFQNEIPLSLSTGQMPLPKFQSYLTTDPVVRAKYEIASGVFNFVKRYVPGSEQAQNLAIINNTAKLLENPLNVRSAKELMETADGDVVLSKQIAMLQQAAAMAKAAGKDNVLPKVNIYKGGKLRGNKVVDTVGLHRIATTEKVRQLADAYSIDPNDLKAVDKMLRSEGYLAVQQGSDRVRSLK